MRVTVAILLVLSIGCGGGSPTSPSLSPAPTPSPSPAAPAPPTFSGSVTDSVTGATLTNYAAAVNGSRVTLSAPGYVSREARVSATTVDLIPEAGFDLEFYRQLVRGSSNGALQPLRRLTASPSFYVEVEGVKGMPSATAALLERVARRIVPELTGGALQVAQWETGPTPRPRQDGWIVVERVDQTDNVCGNALVGATAGRIELDGRGICRIDAIFAHEVGHALGFWHVTDGGALMAPQQRGSNLNDAPTERERRHGAIAYRRPVGSRDVDVDP